jgi:hypothetical protein
MHSRCIFTGAVILAFMIPSLVSAEEVPIKSRPTPTTTIGHTGAYWLGYAVSPNQRMFKSVPLSSEDSARNNAKNECETTTFRT